VRSVHATNPVERIGFQAVSRCASAEYELRANRFSDAQDSPELREKERVPAGIFSAVGAGGSNPFRSTPQSVGSRTSRRIVRNPRPCARFASAHGPRAAAAALIREMLRILSAHDLGGSMDVRPSIALLKDHRTKNVAISDGLRANRTRARIKRSSDHRERPSI
jgi:hypothetical protein